jgi:hypothetical protein
MRKFLFLLIFSCTTFGTNISRGYDTSKSFLWSSLVEALTVIYGGIEEQKIDGNSTSVISKSVMKDREFKMDTTHYQAFVELKGFTRPYIIDAQVREYPDINNKSNYYLNNQKATELLNFISEYIEKNAANASFQEYYQAY